MVKKEKLKTSKQRNKSSEEFEISLCVPKPKKKTTYKAKRYYCIEKKTKNQMTQTMEIKISNIGTNFQCEPDENKGANKYSENLLRHVPLCEDIPWITFTDNKPSAPDKVDREGYNNKINGKYSMKTSGISIEPRDFLSETSSITLKDILDGNSSSFANSPTCSGKSFPYQLSMRTVTPETVKKFINEDSNKELTNIKRASPSLSDTSKRDNVKIYDYFETTTLVPIGQGIASLVSQKPETMNNSNINQRMSNLKLSNSNASIEIPPHMPPLQFIKRSGFSSFRSAQLPSRPRIISSTSEYTRNNPFDRRHTVDDDDYQDIDNVTFGAQNIKVISKNSNNPPSTFVNSFLQSNTFMKRCSSDGVGSFAHLPTKRSGSNSSLGNDKSVSNSIPNSNHNGRINSQISTVF